MENYFELKAEYDKQLAKLKTPIIANEELTKAEKRERYQLLKPKCVKCKKPVGSIFTLKDRTLIALCGATQNTQNGKYEPCDLDIKIKKPTILTLDDVLMTMANNLETVKEDIISTKVKSIFGLIPKETALADFEKYKNEFKTTNDIYSKYKDEYEKLQPNEEDIIETRREIYNKIKEIKDFINNDPLNEQLFRDAAEVQITTLIPLLEKLNSLKYAVNFIDEEDETYYLLQEKHDISQLEVEIK